MKAKLRSVRILLTVGFLILFQSITVNAAVTYDILESGLPAMAINCENQMIFGDFNCDGYIDVLYQNGNSSGINIYYQEGTSSGAFKTAVKAVTSGTLGTFISGPFNGISFTYIRPSGAGYACLKAVDYDNDGDIDLIEGNSNTETRILKNNNGVFSVDTANASSLPTMLVNLENRMLFGDFDSDGDVDVLYQKSNTAKSEIYYKDGTGSGSFGPAIAASSGFFTSGPFDGITFTRVTSIGAGFACLRLVDYDNDGDSDLIEGNSGTITRILRNDKGIFNEDAENERLLPTMSTSCANRMIFGDFDSDGYVDVLYQLNSSSGSKIYYQTGIGNGGFGTAIQATTSGTFNSGPFCGINFTRILSGTGTGYACLNAVDYDNDGDIDLVEGNSGGVTRAITQLNAPPKINSSTPRDNSVDFSPTGSINLNFNKTITSADIGSIFIKKTSDDSTVALITANDTSKVSGIGTSTITINYGVTLRDNTDYYILIEKRAFFNSDGQTFMGVNNKTTLNFTTGSDIVPEVLVMGTSNPQDGKVGTAYSGYTFTSTGGTGSKTYEVTDGKLPEGLTLELDGTLTGTPTGSGSSTFTVDVTDSATTPVTTNHTFSMTIAPETLTIGTRNPSSGKVGTAYSGYTFTSTGGIGSKTYEVTDGKLLEGLTLELDGTLCGTPTTSGISTFTVTVIDSAIPAVTSSYEFTINIGPENLEIGTSNPQDGKVRTAYSGCTFTSTGGTGSKTYAVTEGALPEGLTLELDGTLSGTPTTSGISTFTVTVIDSAIPAVTSSYEFTINIGSENLEIGTSNPQDGKVGTAYSGYTFTSTGGIGSKTYAVTDGKLPEGLTLELDGTLTGTPTGSGSSTFIVTVTDSAIPAVTSSCEFTINVESEPLEIGIGNPPNGTAESEYSGYTFTATGGIGSKTYAVTRGALPEGLTLEFDGTLSGTPTGRGSSTFTVAVTDSAIPAVTSSYEFTINIEPEALEIGKDNPPSGTAGSEYSGYIFTSTGGTDSKTYAVTDGKLPEGLLLTSNGILSGTPTESGSSTFTVTVTDNATTPITSSYEFTINIEQKELTEVILATNSLGNPGNERITGLELGRKYTVGISGTLNFVKADGTLSLSELDVENLGGTEIIELTNGNIYNVQLYTTSAAVAVVLTEDSLGVAEDERITELKEGRKYKVIVDGVTEYVKADGTLSITKSDVGNLEGTEIKGLRNGTTYKVEVYKDKELYTLTYLAGLNGSIKGNLVQIINSGEAGDIVTAVPNTGYHFVSWSDGLTSASRTDSSISANINLSATFAENKSSSKHRRTSQITEYIIVPVTDSASANAICQTVIKRTTGKDGIKKDYIKYTIDKAKQTINALRKQGGNVARIVATDADKAVTETQVNIPNDTLSVLSSANINLQIETSGVIVSVPKESIQGLAEKRQLNEDLYFRLVPIKDEAKQQEIKTTASQVQAIKVAAGSNEIQVLGTPMTIETNMSQGNVDIILPLTGVTLPTDALEREAFLNDLGVFVEHSDGEKVFQRGTVVEYKPGFFGMKFTVTKFNHFTIIKLNNQLSINIETGWKCIDGTWYFF